MLAQFDRLLRHYEAGEISRRDLLGGLAALAATVPGATTAQPTAGVAAQLNHATLFVRDVARSVEFYQLLLGMPVLTRQGRGVNLRVGAAFIGLYEVPDSPPGINHVCLGLENFDAEAVLRRLTDAGVAAEIRMREGTPELYFRDPDNIRMQLQDVRYIGGSGPLGDGPTE